MKAAKPAQTTFDPVSLGIMWDRLISITDECVSALVRTSFSAIVRESYDLSVVLFSASGRSLAQGTFSMPSFTGTAPATMRHFLKRFPPETLKPGDVLITNDPWMGTGHLFDVNVVRPVFRGDKLVAYTLSITHLPDIGGRGFSATASQFYEEGLRLPICKLVREGKLNEDLVEMIETNVRVSGQVIGDLKANITCNEVGGRLLLQFMDEYGIDDLEPLADAIIGQTERAMREKIAMIPDGIYRNEMPYEGPDGPIKLACTVEVKGDSVHVDFTGTDPIVDLAINVPLCYSMAFACYSIKCVTIPNIPNNQGCIAPITVSAPKNCILNAQPPFATGARHVTGHFVNPLVFGALAEALPDQIQGDCGSHDILAFQGKDRQGRDMANMYFAASGMGALRGKDGEATTPAPANITGTPSEIWENLTGMTVISRRLSPDSGGAGENRGGLGQEVELRNDTGYPMTVSFFAQWTDFPPRGKHGGKPGQVRRYWINGEQVNPRGRFPLKAGDSIRFMNAGGGGFGDPKARPAAKIEEDLRNGFITPEGALRDYGYSVKKKGSAARLMSATPVKETLGFQAEVKQLLNLMIHSLYSNKEIFLRELISNASDAADKLRFEALAKPELMEGDAELKINISFNKDDRTLTISDNGVGMSREEVVTNIGTIAKSGTREFFQSLSGDQAKDAKLIGQFGVGFYSAFIVADRVTLVTRRAGLPAGEAVRWECDMDKDAGAYSIEPAVKQSRGTDVILHLRKEEEDLLGEWRLKTIVQKYSDHIGVPVSLNENQINQASALWSRPKSEITDEQYIEFYKHVSHDFEPPLAWTHSRVEGRQEYTQLLYLPAHAPFDLWDRHQRHGLKLYVRRVYIMDDAENFLPAYLRFVRGVVDSADLPLNISREILQESRDVDAIRAGCAKRVLSLLEDMAEKDKDKYAKFWDEFGRVLKEGPGEDPGNSEQIAKLLRFSTSKDNSEVQGTSLPDYVGRMKEGQDKIYYVTAETFLAAKNSPHLEIFRQRGIEVLLLWDRIDEWLVGHLGTFDGKPLASVARGDLDLSKLPGEDKKEEPPSGDYAELIAKLKEALGTKVKEVRVSHRLTESPSCLVADEKDMGGNLARILKGAGQKVPDAAPILEINPGHEIVKRLAPGDARFADWASLLFDQALLAEGGQLDDPAGFVRRCNALLLSGKSG